MFWPDRDDRPGVYRFLPIAANRAALRSGVFGSYASFTAPEGSTMRASSVPVIVTVYAFFCFMLMLCAFFDTWGYVFQNA